MTYNAEELEAELKDVALTRITRKNKGNEEFLRDSGYWTGGHCNWGGSHNLKEDCRRLVQNFNKLDGLKNTEQELRKCTSEQEFESVKSRLIRQAEEIEKGLQAKNSGSGNANSIFGICVIWDDYKDLTSNKIDLLQNEVRRLKDQISLERYKYYEDLRLLKLEQKKIEDRMKENKAKAQKATDPTQKALFLQMIEDDGKKLKENLKKQKAIPTSSNLKFDSDKYVSDLIAGMKKAIENKTDKKNGGSNNPDDSDSDDNIPTSSKSNNKDEPNWFQDNQHLILISVISLLTFFYFYFQEEKEPDYYDF